MNTLDLESPVKPNGTGVSPTNSTDLSNKSKTTDWHALVWPAVLSLIVSAIVYDIGYVYSEAYFNRMSIDVAYLGLPPTYFFVQARHAINELGPAIAIWMAFELIWRFGLWGLRFSLLVSHWIDSHRMNYGSKGYPGLNTKIRTYYQSFKSRHPQLERVDQFSRLISGLILDNGVVVAVVALVANPFSGRPSNASGDSLMFATVVCLIAFLLQAYYYKLRYNLSTFAGLRQGNIRIVGGLLILFLLLGVGNSVRAGRYNAERRMMGLDGASIILQMKTPGSTISSHHDLVLLFATNTTYFVADRQSPQPCPTYDPNEAIIAPCVPSLAQDMEFPFYAVPISEVATAEIGSTTFR